ncbi:MAG: hypothetical protein KDC98_26365, partial [Planctomycetes bacterium]|nr:hypothetical protein [Planctomycetota bacterium]
VTVIGYLYSVPISVPSGETLHLVGLTFIASLLVQRGPVTLDDCSVVMAGGDALQAIGGPVHLQQCTLQVTIGSSTMMGVLTAYNTTVTAVDSTILGPLASGPAVPAVRLLGSLFHASNCVITGGQPSPGVPAIVAGTGNTLWLSDSTVTSSPVLCPIAGTGTAGGMARTTLTPNCGGLPAAPLLGIARVAPILAGGTFTLNFRSAPSEVIGVGASLSLNLRPLALLQQPLLLGPGAFPAGLLVADGGGAAVANWPIPGNVALIDRTVWLQGFAGLTAPVQTSPAAGGVVR